jgi:hypothetical protein
MIFGVALPANKCCCVPWIHLNQCAMSCSWILMILNHQVSFLCVILVTNTLRTLENLNCTCGKPPKRTPFGSEGRGKNVRNGVFIRGSGPMFLVSDDLKILPSSMASSVMMLAESGCSALIQLEEVTHNIGKQEVFNGVVLCFYLRLLCLYYIESWAFFLSIF